MKKLVIINGVTGAIGSACLAHFASQKDVVVYGISRKAKGFQKFLVKKELPIATIICSVSDTSATREAYTFARAINTRAFSEIVYIHAVGFYPFEINQKGEHVVGFDPDKDGIDDRCDELTRHLFCAFYQTIGRVTNKPVHAFIFGGIADKHKPTAHRSWWMTIGKTKKILKFYQRNNPQSGPVSLINISSVLCPNELISRPFVFSKTDNDPRYWLRPDEVALYVVRTYNKGQKPPFKEYELFKKKPGFDPEYYTDEKFTPRKIKELFR